MKSCTYVSDAIAIKNRLFLWNPDESIIQPHCDAHIEVILDGRIWVHTVHKTKQNNIVRLNQKP